MTDKENIKLFLCKLCAFTGLSLVEIREERHFAAVSARRLIAVYMHRKLAADYKSIAALLGRDRKYVSQLISRADKKYRTIPDYRELHNQLIKN